MWEQAGNGCVDLMERGGSAGLEEPPAVQELTLGGDKEHSRMVPEMAWWWHGVVVAQGGGGTG